MAFKTRLYYQLKCMETYTRNPNTSCFVCEKPLYRRPSELAIKSRVFCAEHRGQATRSIEEKPCETCGNPFVGEHSKQRFCSRTCSARAPGRAKRTPGNSRNENRNRLKLIGATECMVRGCSYNLTLDIHRPLSGKDGGKYELGNMYAVCPNHHAEHNRGISRLEIVDERTLDRRQLVTQPPC